MKDPQERFVLVPGKSLGALKIGEELAPLIEKGRITKFSYDNAILNPVKSKDGKFVYPDDPDGESLIIYADDDNRVIEDFRCSKSLIYDDQELIGVPYRVILETLGTEPDELETDFEVFDGDLQTIAEFDSYGLQVWVRDGVVVTIFVSEIFGDD